MTDAEFSASGLTVFVYEHATAARLSGTLAVEGRAMLDAVAADFRAIPGVLSPTIGDDSKRAFQRQAAKSDFTLVIAPECDGILEERCEWALRAGGRLLGPTPSAVRLTADKLALSRHWINRGIPTPSTWPASEDRGRFPLIWKPRDGAGSHNTFLVETARQAGAIRRKLSIDSMIAQDFIPGVPVSVAILTDGHAPLALRPCFQHLSSDGRFRYLGGETPIAAGFARRAKRLAIRAATAVDGLFGYVGVDLVLAQREADDRVIEVNPRLTTSYVGLRLLAGFNLAGAMLRIGMSQPIKKPRWKAGSVRFQADGTAHFQSAQSSA